VVSGGDVHDLVGEHRGELVLGVRDGEEAARYEHVSVGECEGVRLALVHDLERPRDSAAPRRVLRDPPSHCADVLREPRVLDDAHLGDDALGALAPELRLPLVADQDDLRLPRHGIHGTAEQREDRAEECRDPLPRSHRARG
jgi:hypothetical protein